MEELPVKLWTLGFFTIAVLSALIAFGACRGDHESIHIARAVFGVVLLLFVLSLLTGRRHHDNDRHHGH